MGGKKGRRKMEKLKKNYGISEMREREGSIQDWVERRGRKEREIDRDIERDRDRMRQIER